MKLRNIAMCILLLGPALAPLRAAEDDQPNVMQLIKEFQGDAPEVQRTPAQLEAAYAGILTSVMPNLAATRPEALRDPQQMVQKMAFYAGRPGAEAQRAALCKAMAANLGADVPAIARVWLIRQIERIGKAESVAALATLLEDKDALVREPARRALQNNPSPEAATALRSALAKASDSAERAALINAIAYRRDPADGVTFSRFMTDLDEPVRCAAVVALGELGDKSAIQLISTARTIGSPRARLIATDAYLRMADVLADRQEKPAALAMYIELLKAEGHVRCAAIIGLGRAGGLPEFPLLTSALADSDPRVRGAAMDAFKLMPGQAVTQAIADKARTADEQTRPIYLRVLATRNDKATVMPVFVEAAGSSDEASRVEALTALGTVGDATVVPLLAHSATMEPKIQEAARASLDRLPGAAVDQAMLQLVQTAPANERAEIIRSFGARRTQGAVPVLLKNATDADPAVRIESFKSLALLAGGDVTPSIVALLTKAQDEAERKEAAEAVVQSARRIADPEARAQSILAALPSSTGQTRVALLGTLGRVGGAKSMEAVLAAMKDSDENIREVAVRALAEWPDFAAADELLNVAKTSTNETHQVLALRGYLRLVAASAAGSTSRPAPSALVKMYQSAMEVARRPEERKSVLGGLADVKASEALAVVVPYMKDETLKEEAASAAARICRDTWQNNVEPSKAALTQVLEVSRNTNTREMARQILNRVEQRLRQMAPATNTAG